LVAKVKFGDRDSSSFLSKVRSCRKVLSSRLFNSHTVYRAFYSYIWWVLQLTRKVLLVYAKCLSSKAPFFVLANVSLQMHQNRLAVGLCLDPLRELTNAPTYPLPTGTMTPRKERRDGTRRGGEKERGVEGKDSEEERK